MMLIVPTSTTESAYVQRTRLDGREYVLEFAWNTRAGLWFLTLADENGDPIAASLACVANWSLLLSVVDPRRPPGSLRVVDLSTNVDDPERFTENVRDPGLTDFGTRVVLAYFDAAEIAARAEAV